MDTSRRTFLQSLLLGGAGIAAGGLTLRHRASGGTGPAEPASVPPAAPAARVAAAGPIFDVRDFGARGDGAAEDTAAVQAAVDRAAAARGVVHFGPGRYPVKVVHLAPGITLEGERATILRPPGQPNFTRTFQIAESGARTWGGDSDSDLLTLRGLVFDGNSAGQGAYRHYEQQQSHLLFLAADPARAGRLRVRLENLTFRDSVADGISLYTNVDAQVVDCRADDCFRGGLVATGGNTSIRVSNFRTTGARDRTGIDVEVDAAGFGGTRRLELTIDGMVLDGDFDVAVYDGSVVAGTGIVSGEGLYLVAPGSTVRLSDSRFQVGTFSSEANRIVYPHDVTFTGCTFELVNVGDVGPVDGAAAHVYWNVAGSTVGGQRCRFVDCDFRVGAGVPAARTLAAILAEPDVAGSGNRLVVEGGSISPGYDHGILLVHGGRAEVRRLRNQAAEPYLARGGGASPAELVVDGAAVAARAP